MKQRRQRPLRKGLSDFLRTDSSFNELIEPRVIRDSRERQYFEKYHKKRAFPNCKEATAYLTEYLKKRDDW